MRKQILSKDNIRRYLCQAPLPFTVKNVISVVDVAGGYNNFVYRAVVTTENGQIPVIIKHAAPFNKRSLERGNPVALSPKRLLHESVVLNYLHKLWGEGVVPKVHLVDQDNYVLVLEDVAAGNRWIPDEFISNKTYPELGSLLGQLLGKLHSSSFGNPPPELAGVPEYHPYVTQRLHNHFLEGPSKHHIKGRAETLYRNCCQATPAMTWFDPIHRNIFVTPQGAPRLVDFEEAIHHDPAWDVGVLTAAWTTKLCEGGDVGEQALEFHKNFARSYAKQWPSGKQKIARDILKRSLGYHGIYLISRVDGDSGSYFAHEPKLEDKIRQTGIALVGESNHPIANLVRHAIASPSQS